MSDPTVNNRIRAFVERIERLEEEIKALNADKSDVYREAHGEGFDKKALRKVIANRRMDQSARDELESLVDLYESALGVPQGEGER